MSLFFTLMHVEEYHHSVLEKVFHIDMSADLMFGVTLPAHWPVKMDYYEWIEEEAERIWSDRNPGLCSPHR